jgi:tryptophan synthase beta chain
VNNLTTKTQEKTYYGKFPDAHGKYGVFGGKFVPETLIPALEELELAYLKFRTQPDFISELKQIHRQFMGRPSPLTFAANLSTKYGVKIYLKREDLVHGGAHKLNNTMGQGLLAKMMGKKKIIAETGAGQHGFATAIAGAYFGFNTKVFMGAVDIERQAYNVSRMQLLGAKIEPVYSGTKTLKDATNEALRYWIANVEDTYYLIGSVVGPHPYPMMVRDFQRIIGDEIRTQIMEQENRLPTAIVACVGGGSNAMGAFYPFIEDENVQLYGVESAGFGPQTGHHALALGRGTQGVLHGARQFLLQDENHNIKESYSIAAGLDYPGVGPEVCYLKSTHRLMNGSVSDNEALQGCLLLAQNEGIIPALESSHAVAFGLRLAQYYAKHDPTAVVVINVSGQGGKDIGTYVSHLSAIEHRPDLTPIPTIHDLESLQSQENDFTHNF